jgi:hypothetical protein
MRHLITLGLVALAPLALATSVTVGTTMFDTDDSVTSGTLSTSGTISTSFFGVGIFSEDTVNSVATLLGAGGGEQGVDITGGTSGTTGRTTIELFWTSGEGVENLPGDDVFVIENGGVGRPEAFALAVRENGSSSFTVHRAEFADEYDAGRQQYITGYDLTDFGIAANGFIDAVQIISLHNASATTNPNLEDRVDDASGEGNVSLDAGNGSGFEIYAGPTATDGTFTPDPGGAYPDGAMDADIVYVAGSNSGSLPAPPPAGITFKDDFNTDTSANYLVLADDAFNTTPGTEDVSATFAFDYSSYTFQDTDATTIPVAPNTTDASQLGLRLAVNFTEDSAGSEVAAINVLPLDGANPLNLPAGAVYIMQFDLFMAYNGDAAGGPGSTQHWFAGFGHDGVNATWADHDNGVALADGDLNQGIFVASTGEGGAAFDYVVYVGNTGGAPEGNGTLGTLGVAGVGLSTPTSNQTDPAFQALFPDLGGASDTPGAPGKRWVVVTLTVTDTVLNWKIDSPSDGTSINLATVPLSTVNGGISPAGSPFLGQQDLFSSVADGGGAAVVDNFALIDNLCIEEQLVTSVGDFTMYE